MNIWCHNKDHIGHGGGNGEVMYDCQMCEKEYAEQYPKQHECNEPDCSWCAMERSEREHEARMEKRRRREEEELDLAIQFAMDDEEDRRQRARDERRNRGNEEG